MPRQSPELHITPATRERWADLERLFGARGACGGCWCMHFRLPRPAYERGKGEPNRRALRRLVESGRPPGLLAYEGAEAVGWCAVAPRAQYPRLARSRAMRPVDDRPVWSVVCLFVARTHRRRGVSTALLRAAAEFAAASGAEVIEGYPVEPRSGSMPDVFAWTGTASAFRKAGYLEVARWLPGRPVMRRELVAGSPESEPRRASRAPQR
jgi:GNAT superfamily N-acetyltransferase